MPRASLDSDYQRAKDAILGSLQGTEAQIADAVGIHQSHYHRIKTGQKEPSLSVLHRLGQLAGGELVIEFRTKKRAKQ